MVVPRGVVWAQALSGGKPRMVQTFHNRELATVGSRALPDLAPSSLASL